MWRTAFALGRTQAWLAKHYRTSNPLERILILPAWAITRSLFIIGFAYCHWVTTGHIR